MTQDSTSRRIRMEAAKTPLDRLNEARIKYHNFKTKNYAKLNSSQQRKEKLKELLGSPLNAYHSGSDTFQLQALCYVHQTRQDGKQEFSPSNFDMDQYPEQARTQFHAVCTYRLEGTSTKVVAYIDWHAFLQNIPFLELVSLPLREMEYEIELVRAENKFRPLKPHMIHRQKTPTMYYSFDLLQASKNDYRIFYVQKGRENVQNVNYGIFDPSQTHDPVTALWFVVTDLVRFYNNNNDNDANENEDEVESKYAQFKQQHLQIYQQLRSNGIIRVVNQIDFIQSPQFDIQFLRLINSPFAKQICSVLFPEAMISSSQPTNRTTNTNDDNEARSTATKVNERSMEFSFTIGRATTPPPSTLLVRSANALSVDIIVKEFVSTIEKDHNIAGYYYKDPAGKEHTFYELFKLTTVVTGISNTFVSNKWGTKWKTSRDQLSEEGVLIKLKDTWFVEITHFIVKCIPVVAPTSVWNNMLVVDHSSYPPIIVDTIHGILTARENKTKNGYTMNEAVEKITSLAYLHQYFEYHMAKLGYARRVYGDQNNLYEGKHIVHVAGPYSNLGKAVEAVESVDAAPKEIPTGFITFQILNSKGEKKKIRYFSIGKLRALYHLTVALN